MQCAGDILSFVARSAQQTSPTLTNKRYNSQEEHKMCILILCKHFIWHISHKEEIDYVWSKCYLGPLVFPCGRRDWLKDGQKDMTKLTVAFRNFANSLKWGCRKSNTFVLLHYLLTVIGIDRQEMFVPSFDELPCIKDHNIGSIYFGRKGEIVLLFVHG